MKPTMKTFAKHSLTLPLFGLSLGLWSGVSGAAPLRIDHNPEGLQVRSGTFAAGPWFGRGMSSDAARVTQAAGFAVGTDLWLGQDDLGTKNWFLVPRLELANGLVSTESTNSGGSSVSHYDHRILAAGLSLRHRAGTQSTLAQGVYLNVLGGRSLSALLRGETSPDKFSNSEIKNITGNWLSIDVGAWVPVKRNFGLNLGLMHSQHTLDQSEARGLTDTRQTDPSGAVLNLTSPADTSPLAAKVVQKTTAAKVSLVLAF